MYGSAYSLPVTHVCVWLFEKAGEVLLNKAVFSMQD